MHVHKRVDLPDGTYMLTQEEEGSASGELNQVSGNLASKTWTKVQKSPRLLLSLRKASTRGTYNLFGLQAHTLLYFSIYVLLCVFKFQELF
jgi:hypothetical protein